MSGPITPTGVLVPKIEPGSPEWLSRISASKVPILLGLSPWESRFSLYHKMRGDITDEPTDETRRGHYLEPGIKAWFADQRRDLQIMDTGTWVHRDREWQIATPDALAIDPDGNHACVEVKTDGDMFKWGPDGSQEFPPMYRAQAIWQMDTLGLRTCHLAVLLPYLEFRSYTIDYDPADAEFIRAKAVQFLQDVATDTRPDIDSHTATYEAVRELHPDIDGTDIEVAVELVDAYQATSAALREAKAHHREASARLLDAMGTARYALRAGQKIAMRVAANGKPPHLRPCKTSTPTGEAA